MGIDALIIMSIMIIIFYLGIFKFLKNRIKNTILKIFMSSIISIVFGILFYIISFVGLIYFLTREKSREFNKEDWSISNNINNKLSKYEMIDDLIDSEILLNKDSTKVKNILGIPDFKNSQQKSWTYNAGTGGGFGFVDHYLEIYFHDNKVIRVEHKRIND